MAASGEDRGQGVGMGAHRVTPGCQARVSGQPCGWPITTLCSGRWYCGYHREQWELRRNLVQARRRYLRMLDRGDIK